MARNRLQHSGPSCSNCGCLTEACALHLRRVLPRPATTRLPLISLFTRHDDVVHWEACVVEGARNVEVRGTHVGLLASRNVYTALAHALTGEYDEPGTRGPGSRPTHWCRSRTEG